MLGIKPQSWFQWKLRAKNSLKFEQVLTHAREAKLNAVLETIDSAGDPYEVVTKSVASFMRPGDWRAKAWLAERVLAPERLGDRQQPANQTNVLIGDDVAARVIALFAQNKQRQIGSITNTHEDKLLEAPKPIENIEQK